MCYRCSFCDKVVPHGIPLQRHITYRKDGPLKGTILSEQPACVDCLFGMKFLTVQVMDSSSTVRRIPVQNIPKPKPVEPAYAVPSVLKRNTYTSNGGLASILGSSKKGNK